MQSRCWCFTVNFKYLNDYEAIDPAEWPGCVVAVWQHEVGEGGTEHLQGYVNFAKPKRMGALHKLSGMARASVRPRAKLATKKDNLVYCTKEEGRLDGPFYFPSKEKVEAYCKVENGQRTDLALISDQVARGLTDKEIAEINPIAILKYQKGIDHLRIAITDTSRLGDEVDSMVFVGPTGTGKSYRLNRDYPEGPEWFWVSPGKWFDGYQGQPGLVFDEFRDNWYPYQFLLRLLDTKPYRVEKKGGHLSMRAHRFRFSTNIHPMHWYQGVVKPAWEESPLKRRLPYIELMEVPYDRPTVSFDSAAAWALLQPEAVAPAARAVYGQRMDG
ncbi:replication associated protein [Lake Sarah-associated circular virus-43]|uniref:replication associated protein n=1 Tax=Lake Sarah-associated circular virus-43 TaxID=1685772 RepID=UPI000776EFE1|nr:replication associated protein [Lake Sarah-associated circular virus-43]ALE29792.1 replication associated protein [Lake Sarah-associated circular virus-43]